MHKRFRKSVIIETLSEGHTVTAACKRAGITRMLYYRRRKDDPEFRKETDAAIIEGEETSKDLVLTMFKKKVREGFWPAIFYGLKKLEIQEASTAKTKTVGVGNVLSLISALPDPYRAIYNSTIIDLLHDSKEFRETGKISPHHPDGL